MKFLHKFFLFVLPFIARMHPKNWGKDRQIYPQLWYCMPKRWVELKNEFYPNGQHKLRRAKPRLVIERICGVLTGHEISNTEFGYGGGGSIDRSCRWCDKNIPIPKSENCVSEEFKELMGNNQGHFKC